MDNHPIPQDITGFQFKLIGNMTVKQFVYLAIGAVLAWLFFFIIDFPTIIKWPLSILAITTGAIFAFVPIDGRPMDLMLTNFIRALISPTEFIYEKEGMKMENQNMPQSQPLNLPRVHIAMPQPTASVSGFNQASINPAQSAIPQPTPLPTQPQLTTPATSFQPPVTTQPIPALAQSPAPTPVLNMQPQAPAPIPMPSPAPIIPHMTIQEIDEPEDSKNHHKELNSLKEENQKLEDELAKLKLQFEEALKAKDEAAKVEPQAPAPAPLIMPTPVPQPTPDQKELEKQLIEANREREALQRQILTQQAKAQAPTQGVAPQVATPPPVQATQRVRSIPTGMEKAAGIPSIPEAPNLITGIVKDPRGNPLQNILIEVKDQDANPVRAFKTNGLGKFASATSLSNGKYLITFEDAKEVNKFDAVEIELTGVPVMPLEIISVDPREELRRELFK